MNKTELEQVINETINESKKYISNDGTINLIKETLNYDRSEESINSIATAISKTAWITENSEAVSAVAKLFQSYSEKYIEHATKTIIDASFYVGSKNKKQCPLIIKTLAEELKKQYSETGTITDAITNIIKNAATKSQSPEMIRAVGETIRDYQKTKEISPYALRAINKVVIKSSNPEVVKAVGETIRDYSENKELNEEVSLAISNTAIYCDNPETVKFVGKTFKECQNDELYKMAQEITSITYYIIGAKNINKEINNAVKKYRS